ncbi:olfactory receptor 12D1-like [Engystomops pustulosus]|uniref:olfactory receptor 12D1-like n=1 Tax=Engystomops pustulosus TaxID=76066 RepID=UPI003AFAB12D
MANFSQKVSFELIGFSEVPENYNLVLSFVMFTTYIITVVANGTVILLILVSHHLHQPMYIFIANLALSDLLFDNITLPKIIAKYWFSAGRMSFLECFVQMFLVHCFGSLDSLILMVMACDRYVAICKPLRYSSIVTPRVTTISCSICWLLAMASVFPMLILMAQLSFPVQAKVFSCFCTTSALLRLASGEVTKTREILLIIALWILLTPLAIILLSYIIIIITMHLSGFSSSWQKVLYTCSTHLVVISLYYIPRIFVYISNYAKLILQSDINLLILCIYSYLPHIANPIIYCLRTEEIKKTFRKRMGLTE